MPYNEIIPPPLDRQMHNDRSTTVLPTYTRQPPEQTWRLQSTSGTMAGKVININNGTMMIGRKASCDIILNRKRNTESQLFHGDDVSFDMASFMECTAAPTCWYSAEIFCTVYGLDYHY